MTPERKAQLFAELDAEFGIKRERKAEPPRPTVVAEAGRVIASAEVRVSQADPNFRNAGAGGFVRIDMEAAECQRAKAEADRAQERRRRRELDPFNYGHWGSHDED